MVYAFSALLVLAQLAPNSENLNKASEYAFGQNTSALIVYQGDSLLLEKYGSRADRSSKLMLASGTKSFNGIVALCAIQDGLLNLSEPASKGIPSWRMDLVKSKITYSQLLHMTSGIKPGSTEGPVRQPSWKELSDSEMSGEPDGQYEYGATHMNVFAYSLQTLLKTETYEEYLKRKVLDPLKISIDWRFRCADGNPQVGGGAFMTAMDWSRVGRMVLNRGSLDGVEILKPSNVDLLHQASTQNPSYGLSWWLKGVKSTGRIRQPRDAEPIMNADWLPSDFMMAAGAGKQRLYVIPSLKIVAVRMGPLTSRFSDVEFLSLLLRGTSAN